MGTTYRTPVRTPRQWWFDTELGCSIWALSTTARLQRALTGRWTSLTATTATPLSTTKTGSVWGLLGRLRGPWAAGTSTLPASEAGSRLRTHRACSTGTEGTLTRSSTDGRRPTGAYGSAFGRRIRRRTASILIRTSSYFLTLSIRLYPSSAARSAGCPSSHTAGERSS